MLTAEAHVETTRASRYLVQFCKHADSMSRHRGHGMHLGEALARRDVQVHADWSDTRVSSPSAHGVSARSPPTRSR